MITGLIPSGAAIPDLPQAPPKKAADAAKQFEGLLLGQMLKSARDATSEDEEDSSSQTMLDVADQQFAQVLANHGGIGLARLAAMGLKQGESNAHQK
jgi:Rod binding domain-containing protein